MSGEWVELRMLRGALIGAVVGAGSCAIAWYLDYVLDHPIGMSDWGPDLVTIGGALIGLCGGAGVGVLSGLLAPRRTLVAVLCAWATALVIVGKVGYSGFSPPTAFFLPLNAARSPSPRG